MPPRGDASRPRPVGGVNGLVKYADIDAHLRRAKNLNMTIVEITGGMLRAARPLAVQDRDPFLQEVAERLTAMPERGDGAVYQICRDVQRRHFDPPTGPLEPPQRRYATTR
jgi:hypothetical protein